MGTDGGTLWDGFLEKLRALPPEAPEWEGLGRFIAAVQMLAAEKASERRGPRSFEEAVERLRRECGDSLRFFGMEAASLWAGERVPPGKAAELAQQVENLRQALVRHAELYSSKAATMAEERERREELSALERLVEDLFGQIEASLEPAAQKPPGAGDDAGRSAKSEESGEDAHGETSTCMPSAKEAVPEQPPGPPENLNGAATGAAGQGQEPAGVAVQETIEEAESSGGRAGQDETSSCGPQVALPSGDGSRWNSFFWELLAADDLAGAYWLIRSLEAQGYTPPVPAWLVQAVQGARWLEMDADSFVADLSRIARNHQPGGKEVEELLGLAASLRPAVIAPASGMLGWLRVPNR